MSTEQRCRIGIDIDGLDCGDPINHEGADDGSCIGHLGISKEFDSLDEALTEAIAMLQALLDGETENE